MSSVSGDTSGRGQQQRGPFMTTGGGMGGPNSPSNVATNNNVLALIIISNRIISASIDMVFLVAQ